MPDNTNSRVVEVDVDAAGMGSIVIGGINLSSLLCGISIDVTANSLPCVTLKLGIGHRHKVQLDGADVRIGDAVMPQSVEVELWKFLARKYGREIEVTSVASTAVERVLPED
ncbi:hypothetical protein [Burkholderia gladioli]|uniref:hypothetical protein n=1 Tax=Burkholderia gladioli TaxID=28095 RepID=UPI0016409D10|nr:hypothetical protein [Burkholderia gladioli]